MIPLPHGLGQLPGERVVLDVAARQRMVVRTESLRIPNWHDTGSTSPRSVGEVALIWDTISHYSPVLIAPLANFIAPARRKKNKRSGLGVVHRAGTSKKNKRSGLGVTGHICFGKMALAGIENLR